jgi:hypothetical protein
VERSVGLKSYPRLYFELIFVGFTLFMGMRLPDAFLPIFADELDPTGVLVGFVISAWQTPYTFSYSEGQSGVWEQLSSS